VGGGEDGGRGRGVRGEVVLQHLELLFVLHLELLELHCVE
jgi:hypothetical protein